MASNGIDRSALADLPDVSASQESAAKRRKTRHVPQLEKQGSSTFEAELSAMHLDGNGFSHNRTRVDEN